ncbi:phosphoenolpyruvate-protein phosphotransferase [Eubacterium sp. 14-2]|uniref:phosphoenolpyruvate--protein phosphotransferase n=1 Tax=Eubacterium sp. 14-2 TaxID=1235790 RepID=UPI000337FB4F|nr:phosphoenolpyruvate--protein phosphotransferase [Eubacterium sp. 14-2]EOT23480.1 phosphoenolpyruvate-protein phosphotransferase [Eubacterium sp. 14-2]
MLVRGNVVVEGVAVGTIRFLNMDYEKHLQSYIAGGVGEETEKYEHALAMAKKDLETMLESGENLSESELEIMGAHQMLLEDVAFVEAITGYIQQAMTAPAAVLRAVSDFKAMFDEIDDPYLKERQNDVVDVGNRLIRKILGLEEFSVEGDQVILCARDLEPSVMAGLPEEKVKAVLLENGSKTSHTVIIARAKGFVTMVGVELTPQMAAQGETVLVDAVRGEVTLQPSLEQIQEFQERVRKQEQERTVLMERAQLPACTRDGKEVLVAANISSPEDMEKTSVYGCQGVGLYRTEFFFMESPELPSEEKQFEAYRSVAEQAKGALCVIRTLDIGGDKSCDCLKLAEEENPFLGFRAIRICLQNKEMFKTQLRAIMRAGAYGKVGIMLPMVTMLSEVTETRKLMEEAMEELRNAQLPFDENVPLGIMVETPASVVMAPVFARHVDFFSIGTNDLVQYTLAVDRGNQTVNYIYDYFDPVVIRSIFQVVTAAHEAGIWVGMCGEMAGDRLAMPFLTAVGMDELSMSASQAPAVKEQIRNLDSNRCDLEELLRFTDKEEVRAYLEKVGSNGQDTW